MAWLAARDGRGDFTALIGDSGSRHALPPFGQRAAAQELPVMPLGLPEELLLSPLTGDLRRSDHAPLGFAASPAVMTGDSAEFRTPYYHGAGGPDAPETLAAAIAVKDVRAIVAAAAALACVRPRGRD